MDCGIILDSWPMFVRGGSPSSFSTGKCTALPIPALYGKTVCVKSDKAAILCRLTWSLNQFSVVNLERARPP